MKRKECVVIYLTPEQAYNLGPYIQARLARGERVACGGVTYEYRREGAEVKRPPQAPEPKRPRRRPVQLDMFQ